MACEVASALVFLHSAPEPIVHMDLKPGGGGAGTAGLAAAAGYARSSQQLLLGGCSPLLVAASASTNSTKKYSYCTAASRACPRTVLPPLLGPPLLAGNLLLNRSLLCKVGDVGLSRLMPGARGHTAGGSPLAGPGVSTVMDTRLVGTPCYMDPEYLRTGRYGPKSDVYSLGESAAAAVQRLSGGARVVSGRWLLGGRCMRLTDGPGAAGMGGILGIARRRMF